MPGYGGGMNNVLSCAPLELLDPSGRYLLTEAEGPAELAEAQKLRFKVFNVELAKGLVSSFATGRDEDEFDA
ncbi:MAG: hypothetical protein N2439_04795, partial [Anaerolineae bacterium]|nr:hypothetical protein [Anaerolineae bacterium]